ncbi:leader peptidase (prepilin peptidase)/N-methyltransferase [Pseudonocardia endophytica]|uniref:Leader peptidase (Prepilin peptidase)/N-methyltransferase n=2 Tax=Pseudonocardia endophytica TaxID=401976 RepID=A0A4R1HK45_PSEEN|nr:leader peptidase (prepilin peptidase)/N-methyltransferase [Pseudonocardia endophytica]
MVAGAAMALLLGLGWLAVAGSAVDVAVRRLPDALTLPAVLLVLALLVPLGGTAVLRGAIGAVVLWAVHAAVRLAAPSAVGGGDVKLAAAVGAALAGTSWPALPVGVALAAVLAAGLAGAAVALGRAGRGTALPHGPALLGAAWTVTAAGAVVS